MTARTVAIAVLCALALRIVLVACLPDADTDSLGHLAIARAVMRDPTNLSVHWVWLPGWHWALSLVVAAGGGLWEARLVNVFAATLGPIVLFGLLRASSERAAAVAATAWALSPLTNLLGTSAQTETSFALLIVSAAWALQRRHTLLTACLLSLACLVRYEAWAAVAAIAAGTLFHRVRSLRKAARPDEQLAPALIACAAACAVVVLWCAARMRFDGRVLGFVGATRRFVGGGLVPSAVLLYTLLVPLKTFGPAVVLVAIGVRDAARAAPPLAYASVGLLAFVTAAAVGGGSLGLDRHFASLVPFACAALGHAVDRLLQVHAEAPNQRLADLQRALARRAVPLTALILLVHVAWFALVGRARWDTHESGPGAEAGASDEIARRAPG